jgi:Ala-tRNA(Pro) deacylase
MNALHRIERYLDEHMIPFDIVAHPHSQTSMETARNAQIDATRLVKGVVLESDTCYLVAMIPSSNEVRLGKLGFDYGREFNLAEEETVWQLFPDCERGVVPGLPTAWDMEMIWDDALTDKQDLYFEAGDHERLIHVETRYLRDLFGDAPHCTFSRTRTNH